MSSLIVSNLSDGTLSIPTTYVTNGSAKAWVNLNGTGTIALRDSFGVSSVVDGGTGYYTANFTTSFAAADYAGLLGSNNVTGSGNSVPCTDPNNYLSTSLSSIVTVAGTNSVGDVAFFQMSAHGDLA